MFAVSPRHEWQVGDRAYCIRGSTRTTPTLEAGKIYIVSKVIPVEGMSNDGLALEGMTFPENHKGCWDSRFIRLRAGCRPMQEIAAMSDPTWSEAYRKSAGQATHPYDK